MKISFYGEELYPVMLPTMLDHEDKIDLTAAERRELSEILRAFQKWQTRLGGDEHLVTEDMFRALKGETEGI